MRFYGVRRFELRHVGATHSRCSSLGLVREGGLGRQSACTVVWGDLRIAYRGSSEVFFRDVPQYFKSCCVDELRLTRVDTRIVASRTSVAPGNDMVTGFADSMAGAVEGAPGERASIAERRVRSGVNILSLALLALGALGLITSNTTLSAVGIFLYALVGFSSAGLIALGLKARSVVTLCAPFGAAALLCIGTVLALSRGWSWGVGVYWLLAASSAGVHLSSLRQLRSTRTFASLPVGASTELQRAHDNNVETSPRGVRQLLVGPWARTISLLTALGMVLTLVSAASIRHLDPGWGGLLGAISPAWYVGLATLVVAISLGQRSSNFFAGLPVVVLQFVIAASSAIVFDAPRYAWTVKQLGVTSYVMLHGSTNASIDIYQAWPGLFTGVAWLTRVSHLSSPLGVARWWPPVIDLATLLVVYHLASLVLRDSRRAWLAATLFVVGYTINDSDYFSPQSVAYLISIAIFVVVFRHRDDRSPMTRAHWVLLSTFSFAEAITHQLSPYMVTGALIVLVLFRRARTDWAPAITLAPAAVWALLHFSYVRSNVSFTAFLHIFTNLLTPGVSGGGPAPGTLANVVRYFQGGSALLLGFIALAALIRYRTNLHVAIAVCAASGGALILANSYGNEAAFRVVLFALPWLVILASTFEPTSRLFSVIFWPLAVVALLSMYLVADMGLDFVYAVRQGDLQAIQKFESTAPVGSTLLIIGY